MFFTPNNRLPRPRLWFFTSPWASGGPPTRTPSIRRWLRGLLATSAAALACGGALATPALAASGDLTFAGCIGSAAGCTPLGSLPGADGLAVTPNGQHLYAAAGFANAVSHFTIAP